MTAQVFFVLGAVKDAVLVPVAALRPHPREKDAFFVRVLESGTVKPKRVIVGLQDRNLAEVKSGLNPGDQVVVGAIQRTNEQKQKGFSLPKFGK
jgi:macrolide-specific efflux system membrane fusion protein